MQKKKRNIYTHAIDLTPLKIINSTREDFCKQLEVVSYKGYKVENLNDGREIVITKPGGKFTFGNIRREDFMVWISNPSDNSLWLISHKNIYEDLESKDQVNPAFTIVIIEALQEVFNGFEPDEILSRIHSEDIPGEPIDLLLKAYKWIWGQEDINYPNGLGRRMSFEGKSYKNGVEISTGKGILDLKNRLINEIASSGKQL